MTAQHDPDARWQPIAAILAVALPGAGHLYLGYLHRALLIGTGVLGLFFGGLFVGGLDSIDSHEDRIWFIGQALVGPVAFGVNYAHQTYYKGYDAGRLRSPGPNEGLERRPDRLGRIVNTIVPGGKPPIQKSLGRANELGTLAAALAGMMNLIAIIDAAYASRRRRTATAMGDGGRA